MAPARAAADVGLALIHRRRKTAKAKKAKPKRRIMRRTVKQGGPMIPAPKAGKAAKGRRAVSPKPRTVAAWT